MPDIIQLLPDSVANQIAAGEVIQRPASVVKELLENAIDAGSSDIKLIVKDAGKTLIQVIDNGCGMSETDARLCLERHATSKIRTAEDLFAIRTKGFRGEAMASIAAIAHMELRTRRVEDELGTRIEVEGTAVKNQEPCQTAQGTSIAVKNIFFNVPARRKFLKSDAVEVRHIIDEFQRVALAHPDIALSFHHNNNELFHLVRGSVRQRVVGIFGKKFNQKLVPVETETNIIKIHGFIGKPDAARKTRGEQFFFINDRYIKSAYHHHAVQGAFESLIPKGYHPSYFLFLDTDPQNIDINIHPTKTEVKFEDEKAVYSIIRSAVRQALGKYNITPSLDFNQESSFDILPARPGAEIKMPQITVDTSFNPFKTEAPKKSILSTGATTSPRERSNRNNWEKMFEQQEVEMIVPAPAAQQEQIIAAAWEDETGATEADEGPKVVYQLQNKYIASPIKSGLMLIHQQRAHERILFERYQAAQKQTGQQATQKQLFSQTLEFSPNDTALLLELGDELQQLGFDVRDFGKNTVVVSGMPADLATQDPHELLEGILEQYKMNQAELRIDKSENLVRAMARRGAIRVGQKLSQPEMIGLIDELFACEMPHASPAGKTAVVTVSMDELNRKFS